MKKNYLTMLKLSILIILFYNVTGCEKLLNQNDPNNYPIFKENQYSFTMLDNKKAIGDVTAIDPENDPIQYYVTPNLFIITNRGSL